MIATCFGRSESSEFKWLSADPFRGISRTSGASAQQAIHVGEDWQGEVVAEVQRDNAELAVLV